MALTTSGFSDADYVMVDTVIHDGIFARFLFPPGTITFYDSVEIF